MDYVQATIDYLRAHDMPAGVVPPSSPEVLMFDIMCRPIPFKQNEAMALQTVLLSARRCFESIQKRATHTQAILAPSTQSDDCVAIRMGVYGYDATHFFVIGPNGGEIQAIPREEAPE